MIFRIQSLLILYVAGICLCLPTPQDNDITIDLGDILDLPEELTTASLDSNDALTDRERRKLERMQAREERKQDREEKRAAIQQQKEEKKQDREDAQLAKQKQKESERNAKELEQQQAKEAKQATQDQKQIIEQQKQEEKQTAKDQKQEQKNIKEEQKKSSPTANISIPPSKDQTFSPSPATVPAPNTAPEDQVVVPAISDQPSLPSTSIAARIKAVTNGDLSRSSSSSPANSQTDSVNHDQPFRFLHPSSSPSSSGLIMNANQNGNTDLAGSSSVLARADSDSTSQSEPSSGSSEQPITQGQDPLSNPSQSPDAQTPKKASSIGVLAAAIATIACVALFGIGYFSYSTYYKPKKRCLVHNVQDLHDIIIENPKPVSKTLDQVSRELTAKAISQATRELLFSDNQVVEEKPLVHKLTLETSYSGSEEERKKVMEIVRLSKMPSPIHSESLSRHYPY